MTADLPTFFRSSIFSDKPAFNRMMSSAIFLRSAEIERMLGSGRYFPHKKLIISAIN